MGEEAADQSEELQDTQIYVKLLNTLLKLVEERKGLAYVTEDEYLQTKLQDTRNIEGESGEDKRNELPKEVIVRSYMNFKKYETVLDRIAAEYLEARKIVKNMDMVRVFLLILIVYLDEFNAESLKGALLKINSPTTRGLLKFLAAYDLGKTMCRYFDKHFVNNVLNVNKTTKIIHQMHLSALVKTRKSKTFESKPFKSYYESKTKNTITHEDTFVFQAKAVPHDILKIDSSEKEMQEAERLKRREMHAHNLREEADKKKFRVAEILHKKKEATSDANKPVPKFQARKVQHFPPVEIKTNTTQTLREAAHIKREEEKFEKFILGLANGSLGDFEYENYIEELRKQREKEELENIERKKLQALITHEEAILAKKRLIQKNKLEKEEYCQQWEEYEAKINEIRDKEMEELKLQFYVETKQREKNIKEKIKQVVDEKSKLVKEEQKKVQEDEERRLEEIAQDIERKKELIRRIHFLREIALVSNASRGVFDETESGNNGFMYEMSLAELKARLKDMELEMKVELERKRQEIMEERKAKQKLMEETTKMIHENRNAKKEMRKIERDMKISAKLTICLDTNSNMDLKMRLAQIRQERMTMEKLSSIQAV